MESKEVKEKRKKKQVEKTKTPKHEKSFKDTNTER
jgi:hypothetical protein